PVPAAAPPLRIVAPEPGRLLSESYPEPSLPAEPVRYRVFGEINRDRATAGLPAVAWDEAASRVADAFCAAQVAERTRGHYLRDGVPPYARAGLAGVFGYQAENSASWTTTAATFSDTPLELALSAHRSMMEERPPDDGHRRTILDPEATHVGVGWAMTGGRFRMAQEFLARGLERLTLKSDENAAVLRVSGAARSPLRLQFVTLAHEPLPVPLTREEANARTTYRYPAPGESLVPEGHTQLRVLGTVTQNRIRLGRDRDFSFFFAPGRAGLWTIVFFVSKIGEDRPAPGGSAVIRVEG
ncbi:MAG: CAP domain-containing protein, partial [Thermoanaerobaculia bacterium]